MLLTGCAKSFNDRTKEGAGTASRLDETKNGKILLCRIANHVEHEVDDPTTREYFTVLIVEVHREVDRCVRQ